MAFLRKRKGGGFYGRWRDAAGHEVENLLEATAPRAALEEAREHERQARRVRKGLEREFAPITVLATYGRYEPTAKVKASWEAIEARFRLHILPHFGDWPLHTIRPADVDRLMVAKLKEGLAPQTVKHLRNHLSALFTFAIKKEKCFGGENPVRESEPIAVPEAPVTFLEREHVLAIINTVPRARRNMFALAVYTGARAGELKGMQLASVDMRRRALSVWRSNTRDLTKSKHQRMLPVPQEAMPYLEEQVDIARRAGSEWLFPAADGGQIPESTKFSRLLRTAVVKVGLVEAYEHRCVTRGKRRGCGNRVRSGSKARLSCAKCGRPQMWPRAIPMRVSFKSLRATFATHLYDITSDMRLVQELLGHEDIATTEKYVGRMASRLVAQADRLSFAPRSIPVSPAGSPAPSAAPTDAESPSTENHPLKPPT